MNRDSTLTSPSQTLSAPSAKNFTTLICSSFPAVDHVLRGSNLRPQRERGGAAVPDGRLPEGRRFSYDQRPPAHRLWRIHLQGQKRRKVLLEHGQPHRAL